MEVVQIDDRLERCLNQQNQKKTTNLAENPNFAKSISREPDGISQCGLRQAIYPLEICRYTNFQNSEAMGRLGNEL